MPWYLEYEQHGRVRRAGPYKRKKDAEAVDLSSFDGVVGEGTAMREEPADRDPAGPVPARRRPRRGR